MLFFIYKHVAKNKNKQTKKLPNKTKKEKKKGEREGKRTRYTKEFAVYLNKISKLKLSR